MLMSGSRSPTRRTKADAIMLARLISSVLIGGALIGGALIMRPHSLTHHRAPCVNQCAEIRNASRYASWCGGYVQVIAHDVTVMHCDR